MPNTQPHQEIEIKIQITPEQMSILDKWLSSNSEYKGEIHHIEYYLDNPENTFLFEADGMKDTRILDAKDWLRVRMTENGDSICLKRFHPDPENPGKHTHCDEYETKVESGKMTLELLKNLGFTNETILDKTRKTYDAKEFEIVVDDVKGLGIFVEIELKKDVDDVKKGHEEINNLLKQIGIIEFKKQFRGYVSMLWNPQINFGEETKLS